MFKAITAKEARKVCEELGLSTCDNDGHKTFWAYDYENGEIYDFESKQSRDDFVRWINEKIRYNNI